MTIGNLHDYITVTKMVIIQFPVFGTIIFKCENFHTFKIYILSSTSKYIIL